jgi:trehalose 6-phosphate phosphatase
MIPVLSENGRAALRRFLDRSTLLAFDLDGTLAPLVVNPADIRVPDRVLRAVGCLAVAAPVAVITGRSRRDAAAHLGFTPRYLVGNHGAEGLPGCEDREKGYRRICGKWERQLAGILAELPGVFLERKGESLAIHYGRAANREAVHGVIRDGIAVLDPRPRRVGGKNVENLIPAVAPDKGAAVLALMAACGCEKALYVGDDLTDEDVFRLGDRRVLGIHVGGEATTAKFCVEDLDGVAALLEEVCGIFKSG